jgi:hypothetical protein
MPALGLSSAVALHQPSRRAAAPSPATSPARQLPALAARVLPPRRRLAPTPPTPKTLGFAARGCDPAARAATPPSAGRYSCSARAAPRLPCRAARVLAPHRHAAPLRTRQLAKHALHRSRLPPYLSRRRAASCWPGGPPRLRQPNPAEDASPSYAGIRLARRPPPGQLSTASLPSTASRRSCSAGASPLLLGRTARVLAPRRCATAPPRRRSPHLPPLPKQALHRLLLHPVARAIALVPPRDAPRPHGRHLRTARVPPRLLLRRQSKTWQLQQPAPALLASDLHRHPVRLRAATAPPHLPLVPSAGSPKCGSFS